MNDDNENVLIIAYNLFCTILIPAVIVLTGIWSLESESDFTHGRTGGLPMGALTVFVPEVIFGLKWKMKRAFTISCCIAWCIFLLKMAHYFFAVVTNASITYYGKVCIVLFGLMWSIVMELKQELKEYILEFPQEYWLVPCSNSSRYNKVFRFIWLVGVVLGTIFLLMIKWGMSL